MTHMVLAASDRVERLDRREEVARYQLRALVDESVRCSVARNYATVG